MSIFDEDSFEKEAKKITDLKKKVTISITLPPPIVIAIDALAGDVPRSIFLQRKFEKWFAKEIEKAQQELGL